MVDGSATRPPRPASRWPGYDTGTRSGGTGATLTEHTVAQAAAAAGLDAPVHVFESIGSTNTELLRLADEGAPEWTLVVAGQQTAGRGRLGRAWVSRPGASLLMSVLVRPAVAPAGAAVITLGAGVCMAQACASAVGIPVRCKWPNDLVLGRRKLGGVLVEARVEGDRLAHAVIGVGMNVRQGSADFPPELRDSATSIAMEGGRTDTAALLSQFLARLRRYSDPSDPAFPATALAAYRAICDTLGRRVRATTRAGTVVEGRAVEVGRMGELLVRTDDAIEVVAFGEVEHLR